MTFRWQKLGRILAPDPKTSWMATSCGSPVALTVGEDDLLWMLVTGRDREGRSHIGRVCYDLRSSSVRFVSTSPVMPLGRRGSFDENGTSYPTVVQIDGEYHMYYTGWVQGVQVPWYNGLGIARSKDGATFERVSKAPVNLLDDEDFIGIGSSFVMADERGYHLWFTRFVRWGESPSDHLHYYNIRHASSKDGVHWIKSPGACIDFCSDEEYSIARPAVIRLGDEYWMWYSHRGASYRIGCAFSRDGQSWTRRDDLCGIGPSEAGWDSEMICYPHVFRHREHHFLLYTGNGYGASGFGIAKSVAAIPLEVR